MSHRCWCHSGAGTDLGYQQNNMFNCYVCGDPFTRQFSLKRHMKRKHAQSNVESENPKIHNFTENGLKLRHPFTMMVAASTGGEKTWFVNDLLENREQWISPAPQGIIWIYGQWQPLYAEMQRIIPVTRHGVCERHPSKH